MFSRMEVLLVSSENGSFPVSCLRSCHPWRLDPHSHVDDQVQVSLSVSCLLVLDTIVEMRQHVETRRQQHYLTGNDAQFSFLGSARVTHHPHYVSSPKLASVHSKLFLRLVGIGSGHHLQLHPLSPQII